jgi:chaperone BCS1
LEKPAAAAWSYNNNRILQYWYYDEDNTWIALIWRGQMDKHIEAFRILAKNYLGIDAHLLFVAIEELLMEVDIAECLMTAKNAGSEMLPDRGAEEEKGRGQGFDRWRQTLPKRTMIKP